MFDQQLLTAILAWAKANGATSIQCIDYHRHLFITKVTILWLVVGGVNPPEARASLREYLLPIFGPVPDLEVFNRADL